MSSLGDEADRKSRQVSSGYLSGYLKTVANIERGKDAAKIFNRSAQSPSSRPTVPFRSQIGAEPNALLPSSGPRNMISFSGYSAPFEEPSVEDILAAKFASPVFQEELRRVEEQQRRWLEEPRAKIHDPWIESTVNRDGEEGMMMHARFEIANLAHEELEAIAQLYVNNRSGKDPVLAYGGNKYHTTTGQLCVWDMFVPPYENTTYNDFSLFLPYRELRRRKPGKWSLKYVLALRTRGLNGMELARSGGVDFTFEVEPSVEIYEVGTYSNARQDDEVGLAIHANFETLNLRGEKLQAIAFFYLDDGREETVVVTLSEEFQTTSRGLCVGEYFTPRYQFTTFNSFFLFLPYRVLQHRNPGQWQFQIQAGDSQSRAELHRTFEF